MNCEAECQASHKKPCGHCRYARHSIRRRCRRADSSWLGEGHIFDHRFDQRYNSSVLFEGSELSIPASVAEALGFYVYVYVDPRTEEPFYVGKGKGQRALTHLGVLDESRKAALIREIRSNGIEPRVDILVHGLRDEDTAFRVEAAVIDALELRKLTNKVRGWGSIRYGRSPLTELVIMYAAKPIQVEHPALLIRINRLYRPGMGPVAIYEATRGTWRIGVRREHASLAMAVFDGVIRAVYEIESWHPAGSTPYTTRDAATLKREGRWEFIGRPADPALASGYVGRSVASYFKPGQQNPVVYANCK